MTRLLSKAAVVVAVAAVTGQLTTFRAFLWPCAAPSPEAGAAQRSRAGTLAG